MPDTVLDGLTVDGRERDWRGWLAEGGERELTLVAERDGTIEAFCTLELPSSEADEPDDVAGIPLSTRIRTRSARAPGRP